MGKHGGKSARTERRRSCCNTTKTMGTTSTMPKGELPSPPYNLTLMLLMIKRHGVNSSMLCKKYGLNKVSLAKIKNGERLNYAHEAYFNSMLNELLMLSDQYKMAMDVDRHREVRDFMLDILLMEHGFVRNRSPALKP